MPVAVNMPNRRQEQDPDEKLMNIIMTGLKVADTVYGIKDASNKRELLSKQYEQDRITKERQLSQKDQELEILKATAPQKAKKEQLEIKKLEQDVGFTPGQKKADENFAKDYIEWNAAGGYAGVKKQLSAIEDAAKKLESEEGAGYTGVMPGLASAMGIRTATNPQAEALKQSVQQAVQSTLRATLGPQFTEKEGLAIMQRAYDDRLPPAENVKKLRATLQELKSLAAAKDEAGKYFEKYGTLTGFTPAISREQMQAQGPLRSEMQANIPEVQKLLKQGFTEDEIKAAAREALISRQGMAGGLKGKSKGK